MNKATVILGIETSCDETAAAVVQISASGKPSADKGVKILSNVVASSAKLQAKYGGVIPEQAAREQLKSIIPVIQEALIQSNLYPLSSPNHLPSSTIHPPVINAIAVTQGPGLIGSLLVGVETAKVLATIWQKPLVPVNHLMGHFYANWITSGSHLPGKTPSFPCLGLLVSGGHTDLILLKNHGDYQYLGGTRDDAAGEAFDKTARLMGLPYPGGPQISRLAEKGDPSAFKLPRPMMTADDFDFSFSGLKTAVTNIINTQKRGADPEQFIKNMAASVEEAIIDVLVKKTIRAAKVFNIEQIIVAGGVAANRKLKERLQDTVKKELSRGLLFIPPPQLCTDNAAYIATAALYNFHPVDPLTLQANPNLSLNQVY